MVGVSARAVLSAFLQEEFFAFLASVDTSSIRIISLPEGYVAFPRVPLLRVEGPLLVSSFEPASYIVWGHSKFHAASVTIPFPATRRRTDNCIFTMISENQTAAVVGPLSLTPLLHFFLCALCQIAQLLETSFLVLVNFASLVATNAARHRQVAGENKILMEFGLRRAQVCHYADVLHCLRFAAPLLFCCQYCKPIIASRSLCSEESKYVKVCLSNCLFA